MATNIYSLRYIESMNQSIPVRGSADNWLFNEASWIRLLELKLVDFDEYYIIRLTDAGHKFIRDSRDSQ
jgi:hypothetical protein